LQSVEQTFQLHLLVHGSLFLNVAELFLFPLSSPMLVQEHRVGEGVFAAIVAKMSCYCGVVEDLVGRGRL
jgi:hypothetical protein